MTANNNVFTVDLTGLNLDDKKREEISKAIHAAVSKELASHKLLSGESGFLFGHRTPICGIIYMPNKGDFSIIGETK